MMMMMQQQQEEEQQQQQAPHVQQPLMLPMGYKFLPTDRELLFHFLKNKLKNPTTFVPAAPIHDIKLYDHHPQIILAQFGVQGNNKKVECYVFTMRSRKYLGGKRANRVLKDNVGYWRSSNNHEDQIQEKMQCGGSGRLVGERMNFAFYNLTSSSSSSTSTSKKKKKAAGIKTDWLMNEYRIKPAEKDDEASTGEELVLCRIYLNNRPRNNSGNHQQQQEQQYMQVERQQPPEQPYLQQQQEQQYMQVERQQLPEQPYLQQQQEQQPAAVDDQACNTRTYSIDTEIDTDTFWEMISQEPQQQQQPGAGISIDDYL